MSSLIIGVDFDGTVVEHRYPEMGPDVPRAVEVLRKLVDAGHKLILWTMRDGFELDSAVDWFAERDIALWGVNENPDQYWSSSPKAYCHIYIDDAALGCPLEHPFVGHDGPAALAARGPRRRPYVDWRGVSARLIARGVLQKEVTP